MPGGPRLDKASTFEVCVFALLFSICPAALTYGVFLLSTTSIWDKIFAVGFEFLSLFVVVSAIRILVKRKRQYKKWKDMP